MSELITGISNVKEPFTILAFLSLVLLFAFRTKAVPKLFFELLNKKLTKERFAQLLHRLMLLGFGVFVVLTLLAALSQTLAYKIQIKPMEVEQLRLELERVKRSPNEPPERYDRATKSYEDAIAYVDRKEFDRAIQSLKESISNIPTLTAEYTLAYLYQQKGDNDNARKHAAEALRLAKNNGGALDIARAEKLFQEIGTSPDIVNLAAPENGGEVLAVSHPNLALLLQEKETTVENAELLIGFKGKTALLSKVAWLIPSTHPRNVKEFELLVSNESPTSGFKSVGKFTTQNILLVKTPYQEFTFDPARARYVKWKCLSNFGDSSIFSTYGFGLKIYGKLLD
jgi:tetratricopeptide (TPR) repeat protein